MVPFPFTTNFELCEAGCNLQLDESVAIFLATIAAIVLVLYFRRKAKNSVKQVHQKSIVQHVGTQTNDNLYWRCLHDTRIFHFHPLLDSATYVYVSLVHDQYSRSTEHDLVLPPFPLEILSYSQRYTASFKSISQRVPSPKEIEELICYCDGSYSHAMQIGYSGFRSSTGFTQVRFCPPRSPKSGSTNSEVLAAHLAIQYALKVKRSTLLIYTDNSKVEQILKQPKNKDKKNYPEFCQTLLTYQKRNGPNAIRVERIRGHPTKDEQARCVNNREFAKIDRKVRRKTRKHIRRNRILWLEQYCYWYQSIPDHDRLWACAVGYTSATFYVSVELRIYR